MVVRPPSYPCVSCVWTNSYISKRIILQATIFNHHKLFN